MKTIKYITFLLAILIIFSCDNGPKGALSISGTIPDANGISIYFDRTLPDNTTEGLLNTKSDNDGNFNFTFPSKLSAGTYRIRAGAKAAEILLNGQETDVTINGTMSSFADLKYKVTGAPLTEQYLAVIEDFVSKKIDIKGLQEKAKNELDPMIGYLVSSKMLRMNPEFMDVHKTVAQKLMAKYPEDQLSKSFAAQVSAVERQYAAQMASEKIRVGMPAPEISLPGVDGKVRKLSDMKGKVVLLDFWASWCGPCRKANPKVVGVYKKYKDQGFDVYSVSLDGLDARTKARYKTEDQIKIQMDRSKERWLQAITQDNLIWDGHVSDLKKWESGPAAAYGVRSIPKTFLIDRDGNIAYVNPRNNLEEQVKNFL